MTGLVLKMFTGLGFALLISAQPVIAEQTSGPEYCGGLLSQYLTDPGAFGVSPGYFGPLEDLISSVAGSDGSQLNDDAQQALDYICNHLAGLVAVQIFPESDEQEPTPIEPPVDIIDVICDGLIYTAECLEIVGKIDPTPLCGFGQMYLYACVGDPGAVRESGKGVIIGIANPIKQPVMNFVVGETIEYLASDPNASSWDGVK
jgi:hypothetical protein